MSPSSEHAKQNTTELPVPTEYEERVVAFLDILGWRRLVDQSTTQKSLVAKMGSALSHLKHIGELPRPVEILLRKGAEAKGKQFGLHEGRLQFAQFSDSIVISGELDLLFALTIEVGRIIQSLFFVDGFLVRGAITKGLIFHRGPVAFGPALTHAYDLGNKRGMPPRVILDPEMTPKQEDSSSPFADLVSHWFREAPDGPWFLDFLNLLMVFPGMDVHGEHHQSMLADFIIPPLTRSRELIVEGLKDAADRDVLSKYVWLAGYFNQVIREHPAADMAPIETPFPIAVDTSP